MDWNSRCFLEELQPKRICWKSGLPPALSGMAQGALKQQIWESCFHFIIFYKDKFLCYSKMLRKILLPPDPEDLALAVVEALPQLPPRSRLPLPHSCCHFDFAHFLQPLPLPIFQNQRVTIALVLHTLVTQKVKELLDQVNNKKPAGFSWW